MFIDKKIGEEYQKWKPGDVVLITAPTGAGKSYFIREIYLKWMIVNQKGSREKTKILYLVNRKILKKQMEEELKETEYKLRRELWDEGVRETDLSKYITYHTYQYVESLICQNKMHKLMELVNEHCVVVFDECHYFMADSTFHTTTELSYNFLREAFYNKIQIYMSATIKCIKQIIVDDVIYKSVLPHYEKSSYCVWGTKNLSNIIDKYDLEMSYDYIETVLLDKIDDLKREIKSEHSKEKWLIFVDSIEKGLQLKKDLCDGENPICKEEIVFIEATLEEDEYAEEAVKEIESSNKSNKRIIITTPVMDNGISIHDEGLKHIAIMTDDESSFIQMLGRRRNQEKEQIKLYLFKRDVHYFENRLDQMEGVLREYKKIKEHLQKKKLLELHISRKYELQLREEYRNNPFILDDEQGIYTVELNPGFYLQGINQMYEDSEYQYIYRFSNEWMEANQKNSDLIENILKNTSVSRKVRRFLFVYNSILYGNKFAIEKIEKQHEFYYRIAEKMKIDEYAFYKEQCSWIGQNKTHEDVEEDSLGMYEKKLHMLCKILDSAVGQEKTYEENLAFKNDNYRMILMELLKIACSFENKERDLDLSPLKRTSTNITEEQFNSYMDVLKLPFVMEVKQLRPKIFYIKKVEK